MFVLFVTRHLKTDSKKMYTLNLSQGAHPAGAYPGFHSMKGQGVLLLPPGWMVSPSQGSSHLSPSFFLKTDAFLIQMLHSILSVLVVRRFSCKLLVIHFPIIFIFHS